MRIKSIGAIALSITLGALVGSVIASLTLPPHTVSGALPSPNLDNALIIIIKGIFGGIYGFLTALMTLGLTRQGYFSKLNVWQIVLLVIIFGLVHSLLFAFLEYNNAVAGMRPPVLDEFAKKMILRTAITELIVGGLIGLVAAVIIKFSNKTTVA